MNQSFQSDVSDLQLVVGGAEPKGEILELACGTGFWTRQLSQYARRLTAVDGAQEMLTIAKARTERDDVEWIHANLFDWKPHKQFDLVFFGFWLSHVPPEKFDAFWKMVKAATKPDGRVLFVDSLFQPTSTAKDHDLKDPAATLTTRKLNDGRTFEIVKVFHKPEELAARLKTLGWQVEIQTTNTYFLHGIGRPVK